MDKKNKIFGQIAGWLLIISAILALGGVFFGDEYSDTTWKFIGSLVLIAGGSIGMLMVLNGKKAINELLAWFTAPASLVLTGWSLGLLWVDADMGDTGYKAYFSLMILTFAAVFISSLMAVSFTKSKLGGTMRSIAVCTLTLAATTGVLAVWAEFAADWSWKYWTSLFIIMASTIVGSGVLMDRNGSKEKSEETEEVAAPEALPAPEFSPAFLTLVDSRRGDLSREEYLRTFFAEAVEESSPVID